MKTNVVVLYGGTSNEREVSLKSGKNVAEALDAAVYNVTLQDTAANGFDLTKIVQGTDVVLPILHGQGGEDGTLQRQLDTLSVPYFGSQAIACEQTFNKVTCKRLLQAQGVLTPIYEVVTKQTFMQSPLRQAPYVLKPIVGGSSIDTFIVHNPANAGMTQQQIDDVFARYNELLLEQLIVGQELTVGVLGEDALPVILIIPPTGKTFDYENKYNGATQEIVNPTAISLADQQRAQELALKTHVATGCRHISRTDIILSATGEMYVLEINTLPGMTSQSLVPKAAAAAGLNMPDLARTMVEMALA